jgi:phosphoglycerate dehydrogenase-like enzyme
MGCVVPVGFGPFKPEAWLVDAVVAGGGRVGDVAGAEVLVWTDPGEAEALDAALVAHPGIRWVQLPWAGIERQVDVVREHPDRIWTCGKGVYALPVAELALALLLAGLRGLGTYARATTWEGASGQNLVGASVVIVGGGGITASLLRLLGPFGCDVTVVRRRAEPLEGASRMLTLEDLDDALAGADAAVLALALTQHTVGLIDRRRLDLLGKRSWLVNVARGRHVVTDDLVAALRAGTVGGAGLDVTDPEPLPDGHPLWTFPNVLITPHAGSTPAMAVPLLADRVTENLRRWGAGDPLLGLIDLAAGY